MIRAYERIAETLLKGQPRARKIARFIDGRLVAGSATLHRTPQSRRWRTFWRLKYNRLQVDNCPKAGI